MLTSLLATAALMGLAGSPHCVAMCGPACRALTGPHPAALLSFHVARLVSYAAAGAVAAGAMSALGAAAKGFAALKPLWTLVHLAAFALGLFLLLRGRQPAWLERLGTVRLAGGGASTGGWQRMQAPLRSAAAGAAWAAWPCGLLQSAWLVAALAETPAGGAATMAVFALASSLGLWAAPWLWDRLARGTTRAAAAATWPIRLAGAMLAAASFWAIGHGAWMRFVAWCVS